MSAVWLRLTVTLGLFCTGLVRCGQESSAVEWRNAGESVTIQCRSSDADPNNMALMKGLNKDIQIFFTLKDQGKITVAEEFENRFQLNGKFPNLDFLIKNVTCTDTDPYWCVYKKLDQSSVLNDVEGTGSVLLVVTDNSIKTGRTIAPEDPGSDRHCDQRNKSLVVTSVVISAAVLLGLVLAFAAFIKTRTLRSTEEPRPVPGNDVYEEMRGTIRR